MGADRANGRRITEHELYADIRGDADAPPLLFLHGGPGQGCHDFMALQGDLLAASVRLIGLDQRGVDRSAPLPANRDGTGGATLTIADLVDDCEAVRQALGIQRWAVLGQSFGGGLALRYAAAYPAAVAAVAFENPVWDLAASARAALPRVALMLTERGRQDAALAALAAAGRDDSARSLRTAYVAALAALGEPGIDRAVGEREDVVPAAADDGWRVGEPVEVGVEVDAVLPPELVLVAAGQIFKEDLLERGYQRERGAAWLERHAHDPVA